MSDTESEFVPSSTPTSEDVGDYTVDYKDDYDASSPEPDLGQDLSEEEIDYDKEDVVDVTSEQIKANIRCKIIFTLIKDYKKESTRYGKKFDLNKYLEHLVKESSQINDPTDKDDPL